MKSEPSANATALAALQVPADLWHSTMGHGNSQRGRILRDSSDNDINLSEKSNNNGDAIDPQEGSLQ